MWKVKIIIRSLLQHLCLLRPDQGPLDNVQSMLPKSYLSMSFFSSPSSTSSSSSSKSSLGVQNMRQRVSTAARHFFYQALLHDLRDFYTILRDFCDFYAVFAICMRFLRDFYAIFCQAQNVWSQAPKTIIQACWWPPFPICALPCYPTYLPPP